jgi:2-keto-4-pentenoate hydratase
VFFFGPLDLSIVDLLGRNAFSKGNLLTAADFPSELASVTSADDMIRTADRLQQLTISDLHMQRIGWKIGATNAKAQQGLGLNSCFVGPCFAETTFDSPANVVATGRHVRGIESEFGFEMKHALMPVRFSTSQPVQ